MWIINFRRVGKFNELTFKRAQLLCKVRTKSYKEEKISPVMVIALGVVNDPPRAKKLFRYSSTKAIFHLIYLLD